MWALCEGGGEDFLIGGDSTGEGGGETESEGGGGCPPGQICGDSCLGFVEASTFYLYDDDGTLLATFDKTDAVIDLFVTGPEGTIASYSQNNTSYLYYYLKDHIGSTRVTVSGAPPNATNPYTVNQYYTYHPFGGVNESWGSYNTQFKFTGKEHDKHSSFEFDYFGARYYDNRTGLFMTADKNAQFLSAYLYGGNNPIMGRDPDGNFFGLIMPILSAALPGALTGALVSSVAYTAYSLDGFRWDNWWGGLGNATVSGALGGAISGGIGHIGGSFANISGLKGAVGTSLGAGIGNMGMALANGAEFGSAWKFGVSGFGTGLLGTTGGFGLARQGMLGRLAYQASTSFVRSWGDNVASGSKRPLDGAVFGLGPVNFRLGKGQNLLNFKDNMGTLVANGIGAGIWAGTHIYNAFSETNASASVEWDGRNLSPVWGGDVVNWINKITGADARTYYTEFGTNLADEDIVGHEGTHLWQQRAMGNLFAWSGLYSTFNALASGESGYYGNYYEWLAYNNPFFGKPLRQY